MINITVYKQCTAAFISIFQFWKIDSGAQVNQWLIYLCLFVFIKIIWKDSFIYLHYCSNFGGQYNLFEEIILLFIDSKDILQRQRNLLLNQITYAAFKYVTTIAIEKLHSWK